MSFIDSYVEKRVSKNVSFRHINVIIDWSTLEKKSIKYINEANL